MNDVASCEICRGSQKSYHPGMADVRDCWKCKTFGNHIDAVTGYMRARLLPKSDVDNVVFCMFGSMQEEDRKVVVEGVLDRLSRGVSNGNN